MGGVLRVKMLHYQKLCLKSISSHSEAFLEKKFGVKNGGGTPFFTNFNNSKFFFKCFDFSGGQIFFCKSAPKVV